MTLAIALRLGRVSNLPTVWSNVAAGLVLASGVLTTGDIPLVLWLALAASALYIGGMFLNDAYDAEIDARERPERPIPSGAVTRTQVLRYGFGLLAAGVLIVAFVQPRALLAALGTCAAIVLYDRFHKGNPAAPVIMGLCRAGLYAIAALCVAPSIPWPVLLGAVLLLGYVVGLTYVAKFENDGGLAGIWPLFGLTLPIAVLAPVLCADLVSLCMLVGFAVWIWRAIGLARRGGPSIRTAVVSLIAGISILDALMMQAAGQLVPALLAILAFFTTLVLQRKVAGT